MSTSPLAPPRPPVPWPDLTVEQPADRSVVLATMAIAAVSDLALRSGVAVVSGSLVVVVAGCLLATGRLRTTHARVAVSLAVVFALWLGVRASPWLVLLDIVAAGGLLGLGAGLARDGSLGDLTVPSLVERAIHVLAHGLAAPSSIVAGLRAPGRHDSGTGDPSHRVAPGVLRGLIIAAPLVVVLGLLLGSADAVFASFFHVGLHPGDIAAHALPVLFGAWGGAGLLRAASSRVQPQWLGRRPTRPLRPTEAITVLTCVVTLYAAFAAAQLVAASGSGHHVLATAGLSYAEYARSGFFQLLAVGALTLVLLMALRAATVLDDPRSRRRFVLLAETAVMLTIGIVIVAIHRLSLYQHVYGLTMLRLYSTLFAGWIAVVFLLFGASLAGLWSKVAWFVPSVMMTALALLLGLNIGNPEALVVRHNVAFAHEHPERFDPAYLNNLSDDAVPTLLHLLPGLDVQLQQAIVDRACAPARTNQHGWASFNLSAHAASIARSRSCR